MVRLLLVCSVFWAAPAAACVLDPLIEHELDPGEQLVDSTPPGPVDPPFYSIGRGEGSRLSCSRTSCDDIGSLTLEISAPADDRTPPEELGYRIDHLQGSMPEGLLPDFDLRADQGVIRLYWSDEATDNQEAFYFKLSIRAVDLAGNLSEEATELEIHHPGSCGCGSRGFGPTELMLVAAAFGLWLARRGRAGGAG